ncbi:MAG: hypothetical protein R3F62_19745 [Planctomycetota bacterium]
MGPGCVICGTRLPPEAEACPACGHAPDLDHDEDVLPDDADEAFDYAQVLRREQLGTSAPHWGWFVLAGAALFVGLLLLTV